MPHPTATDAYPHNRRGSSLTTVRRATCHGTLYTLTSKRRGKKCSTHINTAERGNRITLVVRRATCHADGTRTVLSPTSDRRGSKDLVLLPHTKKNSIRDQEELKNRNREFPPC